MGISDFWVKIEFYVNADFGTVEAMFNIEQTVSWELTYINITSMTIDFNNNQITHWKHPKILEDLV